MLLVAQSPHYIVICGTQLEVLSALFVLNTSGSDFARTYSEGRIYLFAVSHFRDNNPVAQLHLLFDTQRQSRSNA